MNSVLFKNKFAARTRAFFRTSFLRPPVERGLELAVHLDPTLGSVFQDRPSALGAVMPLWTTDAKLAAFLDGVPTQTTPGERRFLHRFFSTIWDGSKNVVEIGPFLGGTTRAIAAGMLDNPRRIEGTRLVTIDRFSDYGDGQELCRNLEAYFSAGILDAAVRREVEQTGSFRPVFDAFHLKQPYAKILDVVHGALPGTRDEVLDPKTAFRLDDAPLSVAFVDGCKSWFGTKVFMTEAALRMEPGTYFIFQDYGAYSCFWVPAFLALLPEWFTLIAYIDDTYVFQLRKPLRPAEIDERFPDAPDALSPADFAKLFDAQVADARERNDRAGMVCRTLQHGAALAYIGRKDDARAMIQDLAGKPHAKRQQASIEAALRSPTYWPGGEPIQL
jgi:hypothetical protein